MVPINETKERITGISKYIALLINTEYTSIKPIIIDAIRSIAAIWSLIEGPFKSLTKVIIIASIKNAKAIYRTISGIVAVIFSNSLVLKSFFEYSQCLPPHFGRCSSTMHEQAVFFCRR